MVIFALKTEAQMAAQQPARVLERPRLPTKIRNARVVLDLGNLIFFTFQGRAYGIPPLPYKAGQQLMALVAEAAAYGVLTPETIPKYDAIMRQLPALLWRYTRVVGRTRRVLRVVGLHRNPFLQATEKELVDLATFFQVSRTRSSVQPLAALSDLAPMIS
jgi:hypothetical protein